MTLKIQNTKTSAANALATTSSNGHYADPIVVSESVSFDGMHEDVRERLLSALSDCIIHRGGLPAPSTVQGAEKFSGPVIGRRIDATSANPIPEPHLSKDIAKSSQQLRRSIQSIQSSLEALESKVQDQLFDTRRKLMQSAPVLAPVVAPSKPTPILRPVASIQSSLSRLGNRAVGRNVEPTARSVSKSPSNTGGSELPQRSLSGDRPRIWRRWVRLDRIMEAQATRWLSQATRQGMRVEFHFEAPTGQDVWTDVDIILHIIDQFVACMLSQGLPGTTINIQASIHPEDEHWMQISVRGPIRNTGRKESSQPEVFAAARQYATMLGGFLDQVSGHESSLCWKVHFPIDDVLSWLHRARMVEHRHVVEVELQASHAEVLDAKHWSFADRAFQAGMDLRDRAIMIAPRRYLLSSSDPILDLSNLRRRFQLQLDRIGGGMLAGKSQTFDLRCQQLGTLENILRRILERIQEESSRVSVDSGPMNRRALQSAKATGDTGPMNRKALQHPAVKPLGHSTAHEKMPSVPQKRAIHAAHLKARGPVASTIPSKSGKVPYRVE